MSPKISKITQQKPRQVFPFFFILTIQLLNNCFAFYYYLLLLLF